MVMVLEVRLMPVELERKLIKEADKKGLKGKHKAAYVYGSLRKMGWKPKREKTNHHSISMLRQQILHYEGTLKEFIDANRLIKQGVKAAGEARMARVAAKEGMEVIPDAVKGVGMHLTPMSTVPVENVTKGIEAAAKEVGEKPVETSEFHRIVREKVQDAAKSAKKPTKDKKEK
jgi:hypothetical protein